MPRSSKRRKASCSWSYCPSSCNTGVWDTLAGIQEQSFPAAQKLGRGGCEKKEGCFIEIACVYSTWRVTHREGRSVTKISPTFLPGALSFPRLQPRGRSTPKARRRVTNGDALPSAVSQQSQGLVQDQRTLCPLILVSCTPGSHRSADLHELLLIYYEHFFFLQHLLRLLLKSCPASWRAAQLSQLFIPPLGLIDVGKGGKQVTRMLHLRVQVAL